MTESHPKVIQPTLDEMLRSPEARSASNHLQRRWKLENWSAPSSTSSIEQRNKGHQSIRAGDAHRHNPASYQPNRKWTGSGWLDLFGHQKGICTVVA